jgi:hypothetical protein
VPDLDARWMWLWDAWCALQHSRPQLAAGMGGLVSMPWPWAVIDDYADRTGCGPNERQMLHDVLRKLEAVQLKHDRAEAKRAMEDANR